MHGSVAQPLFLLIIAAGIGVPQLAVATENIARSAAVEASSEFSGDYAARLVSDGVIRLEDRGEWANQGQTAFWGYIKYPWVQLSWSQAQTIDRVVLYDRPSAEEHTAGGTLEFSDGSKIRVFAIPNNGAPRTVRF